ncbi:MAG: hypothetical protein Q8L78_01395 [Coxiellaceae bacterium]|nr:hypothetical protein [Coxiellaceae bacterium]
MGVRSYFKNTAKANSNVTAWTDWASVRKNAQFIKQLVTDIKPQDKVTIDPVAKKTFDSVVAELGLTEKDLIARRKAHFRLSFGCALLTVGAFVWACHLLLSGMFLSAIVALAVAFLMGTYAVTENLYAYRIKQRKLDCTIHEWFAHFFKK